MNHSNLDQFAGFAGELADAAREVLRPALGRHLEIDVKADASYVTAFDRAIETRLREMIAERYPDHGVLGEEHGASRLDAEFVWVLDPIDGTAAFVAGLPVFGTLIALAQNTVPVVGVIDHIVTDDRWIGQRDTPSTHNGAAISTRSCGDFANALMTNSNPDFFDADLRARFDRLRTRVQYTQYGGSCFAYGVLASGRTDLAIDGGLDPYDICAIVPVIEGAGGVVTDWHGRPVTIHSQGCFLAAGDPALHAKALALLAE